MKKYLFIAVLFSSTISLFAQERRTAPLSRERSLNDAYTHGLFSTVEGTYFDMENDPAALAANGYRNVLDWMRGRVAGLQVYDIRGTLVPFIRAMPAAVFVDEMRVDAGFLNLLPVADIGFIKVIKSAYASFWGAPGGVIAVYTKRGEAEEDE